MKHGGKMLVCIVGGLAFCAPAKAVTAITSETADNPYQSIVDRNVFSLKPPPPPVDPAELNKPQALKITLTGITTILGNKRVLMKTAPLPGKPGEAPKTEQSYILTEGQREGELEVIEIDERAGSVKVNNAGAVQTLTFEKDGAKLPSTPAPAALPVNGVPQIPGLPVTRPLPQAPGAGGVTPNFQLPTRVPRLPSPGQPSMTAAGGIGAGSPPAGANQGTLEEQLIYIEAARQAGGPTAALLPPTPLTPKLNVTTPGAQNPQAPAPVFPPMPGRPPGPY